MESLRTYFVQEDGRPVDAVQFARGVLATRKRAVAEQLRSVGFVAREAQAILSIALGNPDAPVDDPLAAYVNGGAWIVKCDACGGVEMVDLELLVTMCCNCWNSQHGHAWRPVTLPAKREAIEDALHTRPDPMTRNWHKGESVKHLLKENTEHGVAA